MTVLAHASTVSNFTLKPPGAARTSCYFSWFNLIFFFGLLNETKYCVKGWLWLMTRECWVWKWRRLLCPLVWCFSKRFSSSSCQSSPVRFRLRFYSVNFIFSNHLVTGNLWPAIVMRTMDLWAERVASSCDKVRETDHSSRTKTSAGHTQSFIAHWTDRQQQQ